MQKVDVNVTMNSRCLGRALQFSLSSSSKLLVSSGSTESAGNHFGKKRFWSTWSIIKDDTSHPSHQIQVLRRRGADAWTEARPVLETLLAIYQVCPHDILYLSFLFSFSKGKQNAANQKLFWQIIWCNTDIWYWHDISAPCSSSSSCCSRLWTTALGGWTTSNTV